MLHSLSLDGLELVQVLQGCAFLSVPLLQLFVELLRVGPALADVDVVVLPQAILEELLTPCTLRDVLLLRALASTSLVLQCSVQPYHLRGWCLRFLLLGSIFVGIRRLLNGVFDSGERCFLLRCHCYSACWLSCLLILFESFCLLFHLLLQVAVERIPVELCELLLDLVLLVSGILALLLDQFDLVLHEVTSHLVLKQLLLVSRHEELNLL